MSKLRIALTKGRLVKDSTKIFEAMAMKRPIILGVEGESKEIIEEANCGLCIEPENDYHLAEAVIKLYNDQNLSETLGYNGALFVEKKFNRVTLAKDYLKLIGEVQKKPE